MRVLIFSIAYEPFVGGAEVAVKEITKRTSEIEFDMVTLNLSGQARAFERVGNINVYRINTSKNFFPIKAFLFASKLQKTRRYDIVWSIMANWAGLAGLFFKWRFPRVKFVLTLQEGATKEEIQRRTRMIAPLFKQLFFKAEVIQAISKYLADFAKSYNSEARIEIIPNGTDVQLFKNPNPKTYNPGEIVLITTSRLSKKNGIKNVIEALPKLPESVRFRIVGMGELEEDLRNLSRELEVEERVKFVGFVPYEKLPEYLHQADIFIRPSLSEGFGNSFIEAMAARLPVIATPVGGIPDFLIDGETGLFCQPNDSVSVAKAVRKLIEDQSLRERVVENAYKMVEEKYDWDLIAREMRAKVLNV